MFKTPLVSVCMITYNHERYIKQAIEGVLMQMTDFDIELVIGEDCSSDKTRVICEEYAIKYKQIKLLSSVKNLGVMPNFIRTLNACTGKYIAICEGDDYWTEPSKLKKQVDFLEKNLEYSLCFHNYFEERGASLNLIKINLKDTITIEDYARTISGIQTLTVLFRNSLNPIVPPEFLEKTTGSYFIFLRLAEHGKFKFIDEPMAVYRVHDGGIWSGKSKYEQGKMSLQNKGAMIEYFVHNSYIQNIIRKKYIEISLYYAFYFLLRLRIINGIKFIVISTKYGVRYVHFSYWFEYLMRKIKTKLLKRNLL